MKRSIVNGENRGSINEILLKALQTGDKYGYEINKEIEVKSKGKYFIKEASLYSGLKRLESAGYITSYWKDGNLGIRRHYYSISEKGLEKLNNSNFSWDNSKEELMSDLFKSNNQNSNTTLVKQMQMNIADGTIVEGKTKEENAVQKPTNPFAYVVSENQQDMFSSFDLFGNKNKIEENKVEETKYEELKDETIKLEQVKASSNNEENEKSVEQEIAKNNQNNTTTSIEEKAEGNQPSDNLKVETKEIINSVDNSVNFDEIKKEIKFKNSYLNSKANKNDIKIFDYINESEQNASIVFNQPKVEKAEQNIVQDVEENKNVKENNLEEKETLNLDSYKTSDNFNLSTNNNYYPNNHENSGAINNGYSNSDENSNKDKLKDIFKNLLVEETEQNFVKDEMAVEQPKEVEKSPELVEIEKPELPRIKLDNDVNVTLQTGKNSNYSKQFANTYTPQQMSKNTPSVKQYITKAKTLSLSNKNLEEDISLHGFKIRRYAKMNSRSYKTSNYYYPNILNLVLISIIGGICLLESILGLIYANSSTFAIALFVVGIALSLILVGFEIVKFEKDKYKVEIKNYNFKTSLFYFVMIFIVLTIILVCVNILRGMNLNNFGNFAMLLLFEILISFNLVLYPIVKLILFKSGKFNN